MAELLLLEEVVDGGSVELGLFGDGSFLEEGVGRVFGSEVNGDSNGGQLDVGVLGRRLDEGEPAGRDDVFGRLEFVGIFVFGAQVGGSDGGLRGDFLFLLLLLFLVLVLLLLGAVDVLHEGGEPVLGLLLEGELVVVWLLVEEVGGAGLDFLLGGVAGGDVAFVEVLLDLRHVELEVLLLGERGRDVVALPDNLGQLIHFIENMQVRIATSQQYFSTLVVSPCRRYFAAASKGVVTDRYNVTLFEYPAMDTLSIIYAHEEPVLALTFSPNSKYLVSSSCDQHVRFWLLTGDKIIHHPIWDIQMPHMHFQTLACDSTYLAAGSQHGFLAVWNLQQCTLSMKWKALAGQVRSVQLIHQEDQNKKLVIIAGSTLTKCLCQPAPEQECYGQINIWNWHTQELLNRFETPEGEAYQIHALDYWLLVYDHKSLMVINSWPDFTEFPNHKLDIHLNDQIHLTGAEWLHDGLHVMTYSHLGRVAQYTLLKYDDLYKIKTSVSSDHYRLLTRKSSKKSISDPGINNILFNLIKKNKGEFTYERLEVKKIRTKDFKQAINDAKYAEDQLLVAFEDQKLINYDFYKGEVLKTKIGLYGAAWCVKISPDGQFLAIGDENGTLLLVSTSDFEVVEKSQQHTACIDSIVFYPDSSRLITKSKDSTMKVWSIRLEVIRNIEHNSDTLIAVSEDGRSLGIGNNDGGITVYDTETWDELQLNGSNIEITAICFALNSDIIISANLDKSIEIIDYKQKLILNKLEGHEDPILTIASYGDQFASAGYDSVIKVWNLTKKVLVSNLQGHQEQVWQLKYNETGDVLFSSSSDETIILWNVVKMELLTKINSDSGKIVSFDFFANTLYFTQDDQVIVWQGKQQKVKFNESLGQSDISAISFFQKQSHIIAGIGNAIKLFNFDKESLSNQVRDSSVEQLRSIDQKSKVKALYSSESRLYLMNDEEQVIIFSTQDLSQIHKIEHQTCVAISSQVIVTASQQLVSVWNIVNFELKRTLPQEWVNAISISGSLVVCSDLRYECKVWDLEESEEKELAIFSKHTERINELHFGQVDRFIGSCGADKMIYVWDVKKAADTKRLVGHEGSVNCFQFYHNDQFILSGSDDKTIKYWSIKKEQLIHNLAVHSQPISQLLIHNNLMIYSFGPNIVVVDLQKDAVQDQQLKDTDCSPLMEILNFQVIKQSSILSRHLGRVQHTNVKTVFSINADIQNSFSFLNEKNIKESYLFNKIKQQLLIPSRREPLLDQFMHSSFLFDTFDDNIAYAIFNETFEVLIELNYENIFKFVQNIFYTVCNLQNDKGKRTLQEIFKQQKLSKNLSIKELQYLLSLKKFLKQHISSLHNSQRYEVWYEKIMEIKYLNLSKNSFLSSILCKSQLLKNMDKTFETYKLVSPLEIFQNAQYNILKSEEYWPECYSKKRSEGIDRQIHGINELRNKIASFNVNNYDNYIQDFIFELVLELEKLESIDLSYLNLTDEFCENYCNTFMSREQCPDLDISCNERISYVGQKYLQVLYTRHKASRLTLQSVRQKIAIKNDLHSKLKTISGAKFQNKFAGNYGEQIELLQFDLNQLIGTLEQQQSQLEQQDIFQSIQIYYDNQSEQSKRSQALLNHGVFEYLMLLLFSKVQIEYCIYCGHYVCVVCHSSHPQQSTCIQCFTCCSFHENVQQAILCSKTHTFNYPWEEYLLYQQFKFSPHNICYHGKIKVLKQFHLGTHSCFRKYKFKLVLLIFRIIIFIQEIIENLQFLISTILQKIKPKSTRIFSQEDIKQELFEQLQVLATDQYKFNSNVFDLETKMNSNLFLTITSIIYVVWYALAITLPLCFQGKDTVLWEAHFIFIGFMVVIFLFEYSAIKLIIAIVNQPKEGECKLIRDLSPFKYIMLLFVSTIAKYDFYTDVIFAAVLYRKRHEQEVEVLCCLAIIFLILPSVVNVIQTFTLVASEIRYRLARKKSFKTLRCINFYAKLFIIMEHESIAWFLDKFAANTANKIGTIYIPQKIISSFFKVTLENMPQLVIQLTYQLQIATEYNFTLIVTTISTCASLVLQVFVFMLAKSSFTDEIEIAKMSQRFGLRINKKTEEAGREKSVSVEKYGRAGSCEIELTARANGEKEGLSVK